MTKLFQSKEVSWVCSPLIELILDFLMDRKSPVFLLLLFCKHFFFIFKFVLMKTKKVSVSYKKSIKKTWQFD